MTAQDGDSDAIEALVRRLMASVRGESDEPPAAVLAEARAAGGGYSPDDWSAELTRSIAVQVRLKRKALGWSAQALANRCDAAGFPIPRSTIAKLESGRRDSISIAELMILARALGVAPIDLICPPETRGRVWITPVELLRSLDARLWWRGGSDIDPSLIEQARQTAALLSGLVSILQSRDLPGTQPTARTRAAAPDETIEQKVARLVHEGVQRAKQEMTAQDSESGLVE